MVRWVSRNCPRALYVLYIIGLWCYVSLLAHFLMYTLVFTLLAVSIVSGFLSAKKNDGRMPDA